MRQQQHCLLRRRCEQRSTGGSRICRSGKFCPLSILTAVVVVVVAACVCHRSATVNGFSHGDGGVTRSRNHLLLVSQLNQPVTFRQLWQQQPWTTKTTSWGCCQTQLQLHQPSPSRLNLFLDPSMGQKQYRSRTLLAVSSSQDDTSSAVIKETTKLHHHPPSLLDAAADSNSSAGSASLTNSAAAVADATDDIYAQAVERTLLWVGAAAVFGTGLWLLFGPTTAEEFFAGYLVEQSLSVDNLFVFLVLFEYFQVPLSGQGRVLSWGIYGAIVMRAIMIGLGAAALQHFRELLLLFAAILIYSSANNLASLLTEAMKGKDDHQEEEEEEDLSQNAIVKFSRSLFPSTDHFDGDQFFTVVNGIKKATPLFICMIALEVSDVVFAVDSIPAVFGVTENPLVVFSSNMFAIMGLRSLYTILSKAATDLKYLEPAVAVVLGFIGGKMVAEYMGFHIPTEAALGVVTSLLAIGVGASVWEQQRDDDAVAAAARCNEELETTISSSTTIQTGGDTTIPNEETTL